MDSAPDLSPEPPQTTTIGRRGFRAGLIAALPFYLAAGPFGIIFGVLAREAGLDLGQAMAMSMLVIAGASQLTALQLLSEDAPAFIAILGGAVVNLRMAMYSASLAPWWPGVSQPYRALAATLLHDQSYAASLARYRAREESTADRFGFYLAVGVSTAAIWGVCTWVGATLGAQLPEWLDLTFIVPVVFLAILAPMLRTRRDLVVGGVAAGVALACHALPFGLGLMVGASVGIALGLVLERRAP